MLWMAVFLPQLAIEALGNLAEQGAAPFAVVTTSRRGSIVACNPAAGWAGIIPGMALTAAQALAPALQWQPYQAQQIQQAQQQLGLWAMRFTPTVCLDAESGLLLDITGCAGYFGGLAQLQRLVAEGLRVLGFNFVLAIAPNPAAAMLLARSGGTFRLVDDAELANSLDQLPLDLLDLDERRDSWLRGLGIDTLGACYRLPRVGLARRLGPDLLLRLDRAYGVAGDPRQPLVAPAYFRQQLELSYPVEQAEALLFAGRRLCEAAAGFLCSHAGGARRLRFELCQRASDRQILDIGVLAPSRSAEYFVALLREHLQQTSLARPVEILRLEITDWEPLAGADRVLPGMEDGSLDLNDESWSKLLSRLQARLGQQALRQLVWIDEHRPECAHAEREIAVADPPSLRSSHLLRPLWLLPQPMRLAEKDGRPMLHEPLQLGSSIERIETGWWDGPTVRRDYYLAQAESSGARYWVYREHGSSAWFLHGVFG